MVGVKGQIQRRGVEKRRKIVRAAMDLFARHGYRGTGMAAIAANAGVPTSLITHHFGTKERLLQAVLEEMDRQALDSQTDDDRPGLSAALNRLMRDAEHMAARSELVALHCTLTTENLGPDSPLHEYFLQRNRMLREHLAESLRQELHTRKVVGVDPEVKATEVVAFLEGAAVQWLLDPERVDLVQLYRSYLGGLAVQLGIGELAI